MPITFYRWALASSDEKRDPFGNNFLDPYLRYQLKYHYVFQPLVPTLMMGVTETFDGTNLSFEYRSYWTQPPQPRPVPEPSSFLLFGVGVAGLRAWRKTRR